MLLESMGYDTAYSEKRVKNDMCLRSRLPAFFHKLSLCVGVHNSGLWDPALYPKVLLEVHICWPFFFCLKDWKTSVFLLSSCAFLLRALFLGQSISIVLLTPCDPIWSWRGTQGSWLGTLMAVLNSFYWLAFSSPPSLCIYHLSRGEPHWGLYSASPFLQGGWNTHFHTCTWIKCASDRHGMCCLDLSSGTMHDTVMQL